MRRLGLGGWVGDWVVCDGWRVEGLGGWGFGYIPAGWMKVGDWAIEASAGYTIHLLPEKSRLNIE